MHRIRHLALMSWLAVLATMLATRVARACTSSTQCTEVNAPVCNAVGICSACLTNFGVGLPTTACPNADQPYCQTGFDSGALAGSCTQCGPGDTTLCTSTQPVCLSNGTCGCSSSSQCAGGLTCDQGTQSCVPDEDGGASDGGAKDAGARDAAASDSGSPGDASAPDGSPTDGSSGDGSGTGSTDASAGDGATALDGAPSDAGESEDDGAVSAGQDGGDAAASDAEAGGNEGGGALGDGGDEANGDYILGGGCSCTSGPGGAADGAAGLLAVAFACASMRRRRSR
jgi:MYXO-CTERM domain-containing protein